jgi:hypothetical protein
MDRSYVHPPTPTSREYIRGGLSMNVLHSPLPGDVTDTEDSGKATNVRPTTTFSFSDSTAALHAALKQYTGLMITNTQSLWGKSVHEG